MNSQKVHSRQGSSISMVSKGGETGESLQNELQIVPYQPSGIAVAIGKGDSSVQALKWTLETLMTSNNGPLHLLHVQDPLLFVQSPLGSLPIDQVNETCLKQAKQQQSSATEKLLQKYRKMCEKKKVEFKVHCVENNSIQKTVAEQISKLGISKLVLGSSSRSKLKKFFKGPSTSAILAQSIPDFCAVMVVRKGRLSSVKDANYSTLSSRSTKSTVSINGAKDTLSEPGLCSPRTNDSLPYWTPSPRTDLQWTPSPSTDLQWTPSPSTGCSSISDTWRREATHEDVKFMDTFLDHAHGKTSISQLQLSSKSSMSGTTDPCEPCSVAQPRCRSLESQAMERTILEVQHLKPQLMDVQGSFRGATNEAPESKSKITLNPATNGMEFTHGIAQVDTGAQPLDMASGLGKPLVQDSPVGLKTKQFYKTSSSFEDTQKFHGEEISFSKLETLKFRMIEEIRKRDDLCAFLQEALNVSEEKALQARANEVKRREEVLTALSNAKIEMDFFKQEADMARQQAAVDRVRYIEILAKADELKKELVKEIEVRKNAEERGWKAKQEVARLLRKAQRDFLEYSYEDLQLATNDFCEDGKLGEGGYGGVYMGTLNDITVAVKVLKQAGVDGQQQFQHEVEVLSHIRHPHIVVLLGACQERGCIVYEYLENGSLEDRLICKDGTPPLPWYVRISICFEVTTALIFLHNLSPNPIVHRDLKPGNILLDCNFVSKLSDAGLARWIPENETYNYTVYRETTPAGTFAYMDPEYLRTGSFGPHSDIFALGIVILQVLTGKQAVGVVDLVEAAIDANRLHEVLDQSAGEWPLSEAEVLAKIGLRCAEPRRRDRPNLEIDVFVTLKRFYELAENAVLISPVGTTFYGLNNCRIPRSFVCPLSQDVMRNPHIAADGFTYEFIAINKWLAHHDISPMTNLKLAHKKLSKNQTLQSAIQSWNQEQMVVGQPTEQVSAAAY